MTKNNNGANLGFENKLWEMADKMRWHMDDGEYKHLVLGLISLKYISDAFQASMRTGHKLDKQDMVPDAREIMRTWYGT